MNLTDKDCENIHTYCMERLKGEVKRIKTATLFGAVKSEVPELSEEAPFRAALSQAFKDGRLPGLESKRGRYGGIRKVVEKPQPKTEPPSEIHLTSEAPEPPSEIKLETTSIIPEVKTEPVVQYLKPQPPKKPKPAPNTVELILNGKTYLHNMKEPKFVSFIKHVIQAEPSDEEDCNLFAYDEQYKLTPEQIDLLDKLLFYCFGATRRVTEHKE